MNFPTLVYHEIRKKTEFNPENKSSIDVKQDYDDILPSPLFVTLEQFEEQMKYLHQHQFHTLTLEEVKGFYYEGKDIPKKSILITFDDCYQSMKKYAYPVLKEYGFHAVSFVVSSWLHDEKKEFNPDHSVCLTKDDLAEMADIFEYANHTDSFHQRTDLKTSIIMSTSDEEFAKDLDKCNEYVQVKDVFAYPFGLFNERNVNLLNDKGFKLAFTTQTGPNTIETETLRLKRNVVPYLMELDAFKNLVG
ncbi:polysaccharide deacetylase family protein [Niallia sp. Krafla_26]|uniref:polysaccharide deacetylase family protein n=1 Tax=Niallia sp. Krafla_26 TaxID=3064703 RepID=UPI003D166069